MEPRVNVRQTNLEITLTCVKYLSFDCFDSRLTDEEVSTYIYQGCYSFQDYAIASWVDHLESCVKSSPQHPLETLDRLSHDIDNFMTVYSHRNEISIDSTVNSTSEPDVSLRTRHQCDVLRAALKALKLQQNSSEQSLQLSKLHAGLRRRRAIFEGCVWELPLTDPKRADLSLYYGDPGGWFRCPKLQCFAFYQGFPTLVARDNHYKKHQRGFKCSELGCPYATIGFVYGKDLSLHMSKYHSSVTRSQDITFPQSNSREDNIPANQEYLPVFSRYELMDSTPKLEYGGDTQYIIKCICGLNKFIEAGQNRVCKTCNTWQHVKCYYPDEREAAVKLDFNHSCFDCEPRLLDKRMAMEPSRERQQTLKPRGQESHTRF